MDTLQVNREPNSIELLGNVLSVLLGTSSYLRIPIGSLAIWIAPAVRLRQIHFFLDKSGEPVGYFTWAYLNQEVADALVREPSRLLHISEWNEGEKLWIMDLVVPRGRGREFIRSMCELLSAEHQEAAFVRKNVNVHVWGKTGSRIRVRKARVPQS